MPAPHIATDRLILTPLSAADSDALFAVPIKAYVARDSERYGGLLAERLVAAAERLELFPHSGRIVPEVCDDSLCEVIYGNYRLVYRLQAELVEVVTIYHAARLLRV